MKIIHCADIHLASILEAKLPREKSSKRKSEVLNTFSRMVEYAKDNDIKIIILSGDVFDKDNPAMKDKDFFYKTIKSYKDIDFLYLNGNHDKEGSYINSDIENLKTFNKNDFTSYKYNNIVISGIEMTEENCKSFYSKLKLNKDNINIVMLHGEVSDSVGMDKIKIDNLKNKNIDYLALGHIHKHQEGIIDDRGIFAYPGCLEGRGFDEIGEKGFIVLDVDKIIKTTFIPFAQRIIHEIDVDVSSAKDLYDVIKIVKEGTKDIDKKDLMKINLIGDIDVNLDIDNYEKDILTALNEFFFVKVYNKTTLKIDMDKLDCDKSLIGEFVRGVYENETYTDEEKKIIISLGLKVITKGVVE